MRGLKRSMFTYLMSSSMYFFWYASTSSFAGDSFFTTCIGRPTESGASVLYCGKEKTEQMYALTETIGCLKGKMPKLSTKVSR